MTSKACRRAAGLVRQAAPSSSSSEQLQSFCLQLLPSPRRPLALPSRTSVDDRRRRRHQYRLLSTISSLTPHFAPLDWGAPLDFVRSVMHATRLHSASDGRTCGSRGAVPHGQSTMTRDRRLTCSGHVPCPPGPRSARLRSEPTPVSIATSTDNFAECGGSWSDGFNAVRRRGIVNNMRTVENSSTF